MSIRIRIRVKVPVGAMGRAPKTIGGEWQRMVELGSERERESRVQRKKEKEERKKERNGFKENISMCG